LDRRQNAGAAAISEATDGRDVGTRNAVKSLSDAGTLRHTHRSRAGHSRRITTP
jgi:hypothetical protein